MKILFFGIGPTAEVLEERLRPCCSIIGYTDSRSEILLYKGKRFYRLEEIGNIEFDYLVITLVNRRSALEIAAMLEEQYGIPDEKIISYYAYANHELYSIMLNATARTDYNCMIFGNSHAQCGIITKYLSMNAINFSVPSQDIYGNYRTFQRIIKEYGDKFSQLKYVIIDLYDYNYLNCDTSLSSWCFYYIAANGIMDKHNYEHNENYRGGISFEQQLLDKCGIIRNSQKSSILESIFSVNEGNIDRSNIDINRNHIGKNEPLMEEKILGSLVQKRFENTIKENKALLDQFLMEIRTIAPKAAIIVTLIPRYITMERVCAAFMEEWKKELYEFVFELDKKYKIFFFDNKNNTSISGNPYFYKDIAHLNTTGGICFTTILNEYLRQIDN